VPLTYSERKNKHRQVRSAFNLNDNDLGKRTAVGAGYTFLGLTLRTITTIGSIAILARLLSPADFGYIAMATVITELAALFANFGFSSVLIQRKTITRLQLDTVFWASAALGLLLSMFVFGFSFLTDLIFKESIVSSLLQLMCVAFIISGLTPVYDALLTRLMYFKQLFWIQITSVLFRAGVAIFFASQGFGVWSLAAGAIAGEIIHPILSAFFMPYRPRMKFNMGYIKSTWKTNTSYFGGGILFYLNSNVDLFLIGRSLGANALGYYQNARSLTDEVQHRISIPIQRVLFPAFSSIQDDRERFQSSLKKSGRLLATVMFPIGFGISAVADSLVPTLYGDQWLAMIPVLQFFGLSVALKASLSIATPIFYSMDKVSLNLKYQVYGSILLISMVFIASHYGLEAVAIAVFLGSLYNLIPYHAGIRMIGLGYRDACGMLIPPAAAAAIMWLTILFVKPLTETWFISAYWRLGFQVLLGALIYPICLLIFSRYFLSDTRFIVEKILSSKRTQ